MNSDKKWNRSKRNFVRWDALVKNIGIKTVKSVFFWGMVAGLGYSSVENMQKIAEVVRMESDIRSASLDSAGQGKGNVHNAVGDSAGQGKGNVHNAVGDSAGQGKGNVHNAVGDSAGQGKDNVQNAGGNTDEQNTLLISREQKTVALTFDDGPHPIYTKKLLDGLRERNVLASFFVVGKNIPGNEALIEQMKSDGHLIGNHTYDHVKICDMSSEDACEQVEKTSRLVYEITGANTEFVRPPFGAWNEEMECSFVMLPVMWDVDPLDWTTKNTRIIVDRVLNDVENGDIVLLHDYFDSSVEAALQIVDELQTQGYEFVTADKMLLD